MYDLIPAEKPFERAERLQDRAWQLQDSGKQRVAVAHRSIIVVIPIVIYC